jgi:hypothetical protein
MVKDDAARITGMLVPSPFGFHQFSLVAIADAGQTNIPRHPTASPRIHMPHMLRRPHGVLPLPPERITDLQRYQLPSITSSLNQSNREPVIAIGPVLDIQ